MTTVIDKYLDQIKKYLRKNSIDQAYIEEFSENLTTQLYTQLEELQAQNSDLSLEDAEIHILANCEPVKVVVQRVITELRSDEPRINIDHFTKVDVLRPLENRIIIVLKKIDKVLLIAGKKMRSLRAWYLTNENPLLTSVFYLLLIGGSIMGVALLSFLFPTIIYATTFPDDKSYIFFYDVPDYIWSNTEITGISVTPLSSVIFMLISSLIFLVIIAHLGWKYSTRYAMKVGVFLSLFSPMVTGLTLSGYRFIIKGRIFDLSWGISTTPDWTSAQKPSVQQYSGFLLNEIVSLFLSTIVVIFIFILIGSFIRTIRKESPVLTNRKKLVKIGTKLALLLICLSLIPVTQQLDTRFPGQSSAPIPSYSEQPMLYRFDIDWTKISSFRNFSENYLTSLPQYGGISFFFDELYNVSLPNAVNPDDLDLSAQAALSPVLEDSDEPSTPSQSPFYLIGQLYLPSRFLNQDWQDIIVSHLNSSYPFPGYVPNASFETTTLDWHVNSSVFALRVNTLVYSSTTNASSFTFSFDITTGWLLSASLILDNQSWVSGWNLDTLTITRVFTINQIQNPEEYYLADTLLSGFLFIGTMMVLIVAIVYYKWFSKSTLEKKQGKSLTLANGK